MRERFGARDERSLALRFHAQTGGSTLTAQGPLTNVVRVALQAFAATAGGCQSLHTNGYDEALALPTERSATLALRTQQVLLHESGVAAVPDPFGGSEYVEGLTDELEREARALIAEIDERGGAVAAIESGWVKGRIEDEAFAYQRAVERGETRDRRRQPLPRPARLRRRAAGRDAGQRAGADRAPARRARRRATRTPARAPWRRSRAAARDASLPLLEPLRAALARALHGRRGLPRPARRVGELRRAGVGRAMSAVRGCCATWSWTSARCGDTATSGCSSSASSSTFLGSMLTFVAIPFQVYALTGSSLTVGLLEPRRAGAGAHARACSAARWPT